MNPPAMFIKKRTKNANARRNQKTDKRSMFFSNVFLLILSRNNEMTPNAATAKILTEKTPFLSIDSYLYAFRSGNSSIAFENSRSLYNSLRPSKALDSVTSSAYSRSPPTGRPCAIRVVVIPDGLTSLDIYIAVASPSIVGLVARINS